MKKKLLFLGLCFVLCGMLAPTVKVSAQELEEYTGHITDPEFEEVLQEMVGNLYETMSTAYKVDWTVSKNSMGTTAYFKKSSGTSIAITLDLSGYGWAGIIDMDGKTRYVAGTTNLDHNFSITKTYYYSVFVLNKSGAKITAKGYYIK